MNSIQISLVLFTFGTFALLVNAVRRKDFDRVTECDTDDQFQKIFRPQIDKLGDDVKKILNHVLKHEKGKTWNELATFVDKFGPRLAGQPVLEQSIDYMVDKLQNGEGLQNVHTEQVQIPQWVGVFCC